MARALLPCWTGNGLGRSRPTTNGATACPCLPTTTPMGSTSLTFSGLDELEQVAMGDGSSALTAFHKELAAAGGKCMADITGGAERGEVVGAMEAVPPWELAFVPRDRVPHLVEQSIKTLQSLQWL
mmetsp:Transcript_13674/g.32358  ORF Transcript_13674/g.32358 Transcript_13674/m.32358 type:complete len:126 (+) Transcript_13674:852-1229(+)